MSVLSIASFSPTPSRRGYNHSMGPEIIRQKLREWLSATKQHSDEDVFIEELCILEKKNRADLVHANGRLCGFEIKSEADTLKRWPEQREAYKKVFDEVWLCCHRKHALRASSDADPDVGIIIVDDYGSIAVLHPAKKNKNLGPMELSALLWREELNNLCLENSIPVIRSEKIKEARQRVSASLPLDVIQKKVLSVLKARYSS